MDTLKRLKRRDQNKLDRNLRLEKVVASIQLRLAVETEEERRARPEYDTATKRLRLAMETEEDRKARLEKMVVGPGDRVIEEEQQKKINFFKF